MSQRIRTTHTLCYCGRNGQNQEVGEIRMVANRGIGEVWQIKQGGKTMKNAKGKWEKEEKDEREKNRERESGKSGGESGIKSWIVSQSVRGCDEGRSGVYRLSGVFYLWSKCTLAFLLSSPQMQLEFSLAKQTQMKWLLNDFLGNSPQQHKPSIWNLLFLSLPLSSFLFLPNPPIFSILIQR